MKKALVALALVAAIAAGFVAGCYVTIRNANPLYARNTATGHPGYIVSYRYGNYWLNEFYPLPHVESRPNTAD